MTVHFEGEFKFTFDPEDPRFKEALAHYQKHIHPDGEKGVVENIAHNILLNGTSWDDLFEGLGYIAMVGRSQREGHEKMFSGITIDTDRPEIEYDTTETA